MESFWVGWNRFAIARNIANSPLFPILILYLFLLFLLRTDSLEAVVSEHHLEPSCQHKRIDNRWKRFYRIPLGRLPLESRRFCRCGR